MNKAEAIQETLELKERIKSLQKTFDLKYYDFHKASIEKYNKKYLTKNWPKIYAKRIEKKIKNKKRNQKISVYIKGLRHRENLTQKELARLINSTFTYISGIETGAISLTDEMLLRIAKGLNANSKVMQRVRDD